MRLGASHPDWVLGYEDETWWSRLAHPALSAWAPDDKPLRLVEQAVAQDDPDPKALAAYGLLVRLVEADGVAKEEVWLRFVDGRPVSAVSIQFLQWVCERLESLGKKALLLIWDNASWHISREVRAWLREHNRRVKHDGVGVRIVVCHLPIKSPWLSPTPSARKAGQGWWPPIVAFRATIEPRWVHAKRKVVEPDRLLGAQELADRVCAHFHHQHIVHLDVTKLVV